MNSRPESEQISAWELIYLSQSPCSCLASLVHPSVCKNVHKSYQEVHFINSFHLLLYFYSTNIPWELFHISIPCVEWVCLCTSCFLALRHPASSCLLRLLALPLLLSVFSSRPPWWIGGQVLSVWWHMDITSLFYCLTRAALIASFSATLHAICSPDGQNTHRNDWLWCSALAGYVINICLLTNLPYKQIKGMICPCCAHNLILLPPSGQKKY